MKENITGRPWSIQTKTFVISILLVLSGYLFYKFRGVMAPLAISVILAYILTRL